MTDIPKDEVLRGDYTHTMRDGTPATFPAGTKRSEMVDAIAKYEGISPTDSAVAGFSRGTALGFGDEARAAVHALAPDFSKWMMQAPFDGKLQAGPVTNVVPAGGSQGGETLYTPPAPQAPPPVSDAPTWSRRYDENLAATRQEQALHDTLNPKASLGGQIAGNVATSALLPGSLTSSAKVLPWLLKSGAMGAALGGVTGFGEGEGGFGERLKDAGIGATIGAGAGALAVPVGALGKFVAKGAPTAIRSVADYLEAGAPRVPNVSGSAAAVTPDIPADSLRGNLAYFLRGTSDTMVQDATAARIANDLAASRITPQQAQEQLARLGEASNIANVSPNVARSARDSYILPGEGREVIDANLDAQRARAGADMRTAIGADNVPRMPEARAEARAAQEATGQQAYDVALRTLPLNVSDDMKKLLTRPSIMEAAQTVLENARQHGRTLTPAEANHEIKQTLNTLADAKEARGVPIDRKATARDAAEWEQALWGANPHIRAADQRYAQAGGIERRLDEGQNYARTGRGEKVESFEPSSLAQDIPRMTASEQTALRWGAQNDLRAQTASQAQTRALVRQLAGSDPVEGITARLGQIMPDRMDPLMREVNAQRIYENTQRQVRGGAVDRAGDVQAALTTLPNLGGGSVDPRTILTRTGDWMLDMASRARNPTQLMRDEYARMATSADSAEKAKTLALVQQLLERGTPAQSVRPGAPAAGLTIDITRERK